MKKKLLFKEGIYHEDELWVPLVFLYADNLHFFNRSIYCYRIGRDDSIMASFNIKKDFDKLTIADEFDHLLRESRDNGNKMLKDRRAFLEWSVIQQLGIYKEELLAKELRKAAQRRVRYLKQGKYIWGYLIASILGVDIARICNMIRICLKTFTFKTIKFD